MSTREELALEIEELINRSDLQFKDKVNTLAQVLIDMGIAIEPGVKGPLSVEDIKDIEKRYMLEPTIGQALILQGSIMLTWGT